MVAARGSRAAAARSVIGVACFAFYGVRFAQSAWSDGGAGGGGYYTSPSVVDAPLARAVQHLPTDSLVVTNSPWALYYASGHQPIVPQPGPVAPAASLVPSTVRGLVHALCARPVYVAWYGTPGGDLLTDVFPGLILHPRSAVPDGVLYQLAAPSACRSGASQPADPRGA